MKKFASAADPLWYKDAVIYELHVRAFADSNGDGIGDFRGLLSRLDYLQDLGITCLWLLPFFPSPLRDDGYDIANYVDVNPAYGTLDDFRDFLTAAHARNMQVMIELVINHTSDQHPWFKAARLAPPGSPQRNMYVWSSTDQLYKDARIIFTDTEKSNWTWDETAQAYYWHRFFSHQPDLNFDNPLVLEEVLKAMRFWLDMGVDGLRMDAIPYLCERDGTSCENLPETHTVVRSLRATIDAEYANRLILAEANQWPADVRPYFGDGDECHMAFHFPLMPRIYMALRQEDRLPITDIMARTPPIPPGCQWGLFLRNHDELTLEMVTDDERDYMYFAYSADPRMRVNVGIRRRLAPLVDNNRRRIELLNSILLSFPGTPILYYGDEIGMGDNIYLGDRNGVRTPMQWTSDRNAGFSRCDPARLYFPVIMDPVYGYQVVNVETQLADASSLLHWMRNMIALRKLFQVFGRGTLTFLNPANRKVLAYLRDLERHDGTHETVLCVANLSRFAQPLALDLSAYEGLAPVEMLGYVPFPTITAEPYPLTLAPYSFLWLELQQPAPKQDAESAPSVGAPSKVAPSTDMLLQALRTDGWTAAFSGAGRVALESTLAAWLPRQRWFGAKASIIQSVHLLDWAELPAETPGLPTPILLLIEVENAGGNREVYQLPLVLSTGADAERITADQPNAILLRVEAPEAAALHDGIVREDVQRALLSLIARNASLPLASLAPGTQDSAAGPHPLSALAPVAPAPLDAQPGEASAPPRDAASSLLTSAQRMQPHEAPDAVASAPRAGEIAAQASSAFPAHTHIEQFTPTLATGEQSNSSVLYGRRFILKLFRRLQAGVNPDVEICRFLTDGPHFAHIPPFLGDIAATPEGGSTTTIAMLQALVENQGDGWSWFLAQVTGFLSSASGPAPDVPRKLVYGEPLPIPSQLAQNVALAAARLLGLRTAEMHVALASATTDPAFTAEPLSADFLALDAARIERQLTTAFTALRPRLSALEDGPADAAIDLLARRHELTAHARAVATLPASGLRIRVHGDYHLGQILRTYAADGAGDFVLLDFEGEPTRSLADRRTKQSPLKDVAGMLRSFSYVASAGLAHLSETARAQDTTKAWARTWEACAASEFLSGYRAGLASRPDLVPGPATFQPLLRAYLLEKALYELLYELNHRPSWLPIPLVGIQAL